ncbi:MAG: insulinase family protein [Acidobacteria bacterium]|nr:insulinase family protein [Acidobacteriota bacterium]
MKRMLICLLAPACTIGLFLPAVSIAQLKAPRLNYRERTLGNGLKVYSLVDETSPTVSVQVWYKVGAKDDPAGRSGFAHLFEHMMFKRTKNLKAEMFDRFTEDVGGFNNAQTWDDYTDYFEVVPSNYLETLLWAEADRMSSLVVDEEVFKSEREVVKEEYRQRILASPYGRFFLLLQQKSFTQHPYQRPGIGSLEDLNAATVEDVRAFHATFYRPDNATLIVAGDFEPAQLDAWVDKYFARILKPDRPIPRVSSNEPERRAQRRFTEFLPNAPLTALGISYLTPPAAHADAAALQVAEAILSAGESSRLYQSLVYQQQLAVNAFTVSTPTEDTGYFALAAIVSSGKQPEATERAVLAEIDSLQKSPVKAAELDKAKNQLLTGLLRLRETNHGRANAIGLAAVLLGNAHRVNTGLERLQAVTAADVQRVMKRYFNPDSRVVVICYPEAMRDKSIRGESRQQ